MRKKLMISKTAAIATLVDWYLQKLYEHKSMHLLCISGYYTSFKLLATSNFITELVGVS